MRRGRSAKGVERPLRGNASHVSNWSLRSWISLLLLLKLLMGELGELQVLADKENSIRSDQPVDNRPTPWMTAQTSVAGLQKSSVPLALQDPFEPAVLDTIELH